MLVEFFIGRWPKIRRGQEAPPPGPPMRLARMAFFLPWPLGFDVGRKWLLLIFQAESFLFFGPTIFRQYIYYCI